MPDWFERRQDALAWSKIMQIVDQATGKTLTTKAALDDIEAVILDRMLDD